MTKKKPTTARKARSLQHATGQKYTEALRAVGPQTPEALLVAALHRAGLTTEAANLTWLDHRRTKAAREPSLIDDYLCIDWEESLIEAVFAALVTASTRPDSAFLLAPAAGVLDTLSAGVTADFIRGQQLSPVPDTVDVDTASPCARLAHAAAQAMAKAALVPFGGDEEWGNCIELIEQARDLTHQAAVHSA